MCTGQIRNDINSKIQTAEEKYESDSVHGGEICESPGYDMYTSEVYGRCS